MNDPDLEIVGEIDGTFHPDESINTACLKSFKEREIHGLNYFRLLKRFLKPKEKMNHIEAVIYYVCQGIPSSTDELMPYRVFSLLDHTTIEVTDINSRKIHPAMKQIAILEMRAVGLWMLEHKGERCSAESLHRIMNDITVSRVKGIKRSEDKPYVTTALPKLKGGMKEWITWKLDAMGILGQSGLLEVINDLQYANSHPKSSAVVFGMLRSATSNMVGPNVSYFLSNGDGGIPKCGFTAWKKISEQFEGELFLDAQVEDINLELTNLVFKTGIVAFNMKFAGLRNHMLALEQLIEQKRLTLQKNTFTDLDSEQWVSKYSQKLDNSVYSKYLQQAIAKHPRDLDMFMAFVRKSYDDDHKAGSVQRARPKRSHNDDESDSDNNAGSSPKYHKNHDGKNTADLSALLKLPDLPEEVKNSIKNSMKKGSDASDKPSKNKRFRNRKNKKSKPSGESNKTRRSSGNEAYGSHDFPDSSVYAMDNGLCDDFFD